MYNLTSFDMQGSTVINNVSIVTYYATVSFVPDMASYSVQKNVQDLEKYEQNKETCDADFTAFEEKVAEIAQSNSL